MYVGFNSEEHSVCGETRNYFQWRYYIFDFISSKKTSVYTAVEITEIYSHAFLAKISWKQRIY